MPKAATSRASWTTVAFGDVVRLSTERSSDPESAGFDRFVGLDHIEPGDLRIRRWGDIADGTTFTSVFHPGQVLFGKRRAYQRKVAVADFSGVCSGDIYVLEPKGKDLLPELLPFICQTDAFFEHAVGTSAGSLSPRTNWTSLSGFEFALPPIEEQRRIARLLWAVDATMDGHFETTEALDAVSSAAALDLLHLRGVSLSSGGVLSRLPHGWRWSKGHELFTAMSGNGEPTPCPDGDSLFLKVADFNRNERETAIVNAETRFSGEACHGIRLFGPGTIVFPKRGASIFLNKAGVLLRSAALDPNLMALVPISEKITSEFLYWSVKSIGLWRFADTTSLPQLNHKHLNPALFPLPPMDKQLRIVSRIGATLSLRFEADARRHRLQSIRSELLAAVLAERQP